jgi:molecular chaperone GrpE
MGGRVLVAEGGRIEADEVAIPPSPLSSSVPLTSPGSNLLSTAQDASEPATGEAADGTSDRLAAICTSVNRLADSAEHYHVRAQQREAVIDHLSSEVDRLRRGDRRGILRPLLAEVCRLRNDLLRQADDLPADFDAERARLLLRSYAETVELMLEDNGVIAYSVGKGDPFDPRMHRRVGDEPAADVSAAGHVAAIRRGGYLDVEANSPIAPAEVIVFSRSPAEPDAASGTNERNEQ